jgi:hypothetical protein
VPHVLGGLFLAFLRAMRLFIVPDVFPTTASAGRLFAKRFLGSSAILRQLAAVTIHWDACAQHVATATSEKILKIWSRRGILFAEVVLDVTKRINDWRLMSMLQAKN